MEHGATESVNRRGSPVASKMTKMISSTNLEMTTHIDKLISQGETRRIPHLSRILLATIVPMVTIIIMSVISLNTAMERRTSANREIEDIRQFVVVDKLINCLEKERTVSSTFLSLRDSSETLYDELKQIQSICNQALQDVTVWRETHLNSEDENINISHSFLKILVVHRQAVNNFSMDAVENLVIYTSVMQKFIDWTANLINLPGLDNLMNSMKTLSGMLRVSDVIGTQRALGSIFLNTCNITSAQYEWFSDMTGEASAYYTIAFSNTEAAIILHKDLVVGSDMEAAIEQQKTTFVKGNFQSICKSLSHEERIANRSNWLSNMNQYMTIIKEIKEHTLIEALRRSKQMNGDARRDFWLQLISLVVITLLCIVLGIWCAMRIHKSLSDVILLTDELGLKTKELGEDVQRTDRLLYRMLPIPVAHALKSQKSVLAEHYENVTIFFSDIIRFCDIAAKHSPLEVVSILNLMYSMFDGVINSYHVYKVETIMDTYMVVSGLPDRYSQHAREMCCVAFELLKGLKELEIVSKDMSEVRIRIGIHTGPCVAGVVGNTMPRYCLFGDTVNTASRLSTSSLPNRIHVSESTRIMLKEEDGFVFKLRDQVDLKGKSDMTTYWLEKKERYRRSMEREAFIMTTA